MAPFCNINRTTRFGFCHPTGWSKHPKLSRCALKARISVTEINVRNKM